MPRLQSSLILALGFTKLSPLPISYWHCYSRATASAVIQAESPLLFKRWLGLPSLGQTGVTGSWSLPGSFELGSPRYHAIPGVVAGLSPA